MIEVVQILVKVKVECDIMGRKATRFFAQPFLVVQSGVNFGS